MEPESHVVIEVIADGGAVYFGAERPGDRPGFDAAIAHAGLLVSSKVMAGLGEGQSKVRHWR